MVDPRTPDFLSRPAPRWHQTGPAKGARARRDPDPDPCPRVGSGPRPGSLAHLRSAFSSGLRCVRRCRFRAWVGPPLSASGLAPRWPAGSMSGIFRPAGAPAAAVGLLGRRSTLGAPAAGLCADATTTIAQECLLQCALPPPSLPAVPPQPFYGRGHPRLASAV